MEAKTKEDVFDQMIEFGNAANKTPLYLEGAIERIGEQMDKESELRIRNWLAVNMTQRPDILEAASRSGTVAMPANSFVQVGEILRDVLAASAHEAITEQNFQAAQSVLREGDL